MIHEIIEIFRRIELLYLDLFFFREFSYLRYNSVHSSWQYTEVMTVVIFLHRQSKLR